MDYDSAFPKGKRKKNRKLLAEIKKRPCLVCFKTPSDPAHIQSVGAGGGDTEDNVIPLCRDCHQEQHRIGIKSFTAKHEAVQAWRNQVKSNLKGE